MNYSTSFDINSIIPNKKRTPDFEILNFSGKINNNSKDYEIFNVVTDDGDSIYSPSYEELATIRGQIFISEDIINEIIQEKLDKR